MKKYHQSVLLEETIGLLNVKKQALYIDATAGGGGHTLEILKRGGKVLAIDRDPEAIKHIKKQSQKFQIGRDLFLANENFNKISSIAKENSFENVSGIIFDLGVSSHQLESAQRGFSFSKLGPLDMRMDPDISVAASDIINNFDKRRLNEIFKKFSQEKLSWPIADAIFRARQIKPIETTTELARIVKEVYQKHENRYRGSRAKRGVRNINPATKVFQSLRIVVNSELLNLEESLPQTVNLLNKSGRLVVISFHSLEDAIVKRFFKASQDLKVLTKSPIGPGTWELLTNPKSRSAKLRAAEKI